MNMWEYKQLVTRSSLSLAQRLLHHEHTLDLRVTGQEAVAVLPIATSPAQLLGVQAGSPGVRSKIKSIGIYLLLLLGSQGSLRKLLTGFNVWFFPLLWFCRWLLQRYSCPVLPAL